MNFLYEAGQKYFNYIFVFSIVILLISRISKIKNKSIRSILLLFVVVFNVYLFCTVDGTTRFICFTNGKIIETFGTVYRSQNIDGQIYTTIISGNQQVDYVIRCLKVGLFYIGIFIRSI